MLDEDTIHLVLAFAGTPAVCAAFVRRQRGRRALRMQAALAGRRPPPDICPGCDVRVLPASGPRLLLGRWSRRVCYSCLYSGRKRHLGFFGAATAAATARAHGWRAPPGRARHFF